MADRQIPYDGMPTPTTKSEPELNEDEMMGYILRSTSEKNLSYEDVKAVIDAETKYLEEKGFIDTK